MSSFTSPNQLGTDGICYNPAQADLDMNGFSVINAGGGGGTITNIFGTPGQIGVAIAGTDATVSLVPTAVTPGSYTNTNITVDGLGRITSASSGPSSSASDWANYPAIATINGGNQVMNSIRQIALSNPASTKALTVNYDNLTYAPGSGASMIDVNIGAETGEILTTCPSSKPTLSYNSGTETLSLLGPTTSGTTVLSSVALPGSGVETLAQVLARGNSAGTNNISMNTTQKIINCADPTSAQDVATKAYVDARPAETLATTLIAGNNCGANGIDMNGNSLLGANNITMPGIAPIITATNAVGTLSITALGGTNMATTGICNITSVGPLNLGSATYTSLENLRIDNSAITKQSGADLSIDNLAYIRNNQAMITLNPDSVNPIVFIDSATPTGQVVIQTNSVPTCTFTNTAITANKPLNFAGSLTGALNASLNNITGVNSLAITNNGTQIGTLSYDNTNNAIQTSVKLRTPTLVDKNQATGTANQVLTSDGAGAIEWATIGSGGSQTLAQVLANGNSAGAYQIAMNNQGIGGVGFIELIDTTNPTGSVSVLQYRVLGNRVYMQSGLNIGATDTSTGVFLVTPNFALRDYNGGGQSVAMLFDQASQTIKVGTAGGASGINAKLSLPNNLIMNGYTIQQTRFADLSNSTGTAGQVITANGSGDWAWTTPTVSPASVNTPIAFGSNITPQINQSATLTTSFQQLLINSTGGTVNFTMPTLNAGANSLVVQVSCPNGAWTTGLPGSIFACYLDLFDVTTNTTIAGNYQGGANGFTVVPYTNSFGADYFNFQITDTFYPAPTAGHNIQVRVWVKLPSIPSPAPLLVLSACSVTVTQTVTQ